ncbi:HAD family phosphatase [Microbulbifer sp. SAOS-129_SWC]|uniref:HAD family hydrolase n=1 Tax=Microbulbifer sp. SAOS-129_SWC TaxID=3145235 RepID=UPI003217FED7
MTIKAILFDHDGTLVDSEPAHFSIWQKVLAPYGVDLSEAIYREYCAGLPAPDNARDLISRYAIEAQPEQLVRDKIAATRRFLESAAFPLMPGALEVVQHCHSLGLRLAIVTGSGRAVVEATARSHGWQPLFETLISADDVARNKPHPDGYQLALQRLGLEPGHCIAIEDTEHGLAAADAAGVPCLAVPNEMSREHDFSRATGRFDSLADAAHWVAARRG